MKLINIGYGNLISQERIIAIVPPESAPIKRRIQENRDNPLLIDATAGRRTRSVIFMDDGHFILSALQPDTLQNRLTEEESVKGRAE